MRNNFDTFDGTFKNKNGIPVRPFFFFCSLLAFLTACHSAQKGSDCATTPSAIFSADLPDVDAHDFHQTGAEGLEIVSFHSGVFLEVFQTGCDSLRQEFRFRIPGIEESETPGFWLEEAQNQFRALGALGPEYAPFTHYADALALQDEAFHLAQPMEVDNGFWIQIDQIKSFDGPTLIIVLANYEM